MGTGLKHREPNSIVEEAKREQCEGIIFCLNEPTVSLPSFVRVAELAKKNKLFVACSTNGYFSEEALALLLPLLDGVNIGLKGIDPLQLQSCGIPDRTLIIRNISRMIEAGIHVEVALMHEQVTQAVAGAPRPQVLYTMGYPTFALNAERFENQLVYEAGGDPVNRFIQRT
jgi:pyruvate-formate lyase-activating enzyme